MCRVGTAHRRRGDRPRRWWAVPRPRVAAEKTRQPWALLHNAFGVARVSNGQVYGVVIILLAIILHASRLTTAAAEGPRAEVQRIVSLAPSVTESVFALGMGDKLVGVSIYCDYPPAGTAHRAGRELPDTEHRGDRRQASGRGDRGAEPGEPESGGDVAPSGVDGCGRGAEYDRRDRGLAAHHRPGDRPRGGGARVGGKHRGAARRPAGAGRRRAAAHGADGRRADAADRRGQRLVSGRAHPHGRRHQSGRASRAAAGRI